MAIFERLTANDSTKIPVHAFASYLHLVCSNSENLGVVAKARMITALNLSVGDQTELDAIISKYNGIANAANKVEFMRRIDAVFLLAEAGHLTKAEARTLIGF